MSNRQRRALVQIPADQLEHLLDFPAGCEVLFIGADFIRQSVLVVVQSDDFQPVPEGAEPPLLGGAFSRRSIVVDGEVYFRWAWTPRDDA